MEEKRAPLAKRGGTSTYSTSTNARRNRMLMREEMITKKITQIFADKERDMIKEIWDTILEDKLKVYKLMRVEYEENFVELDADRKRIHKKRKNKKERNKMLRQNTKQQLYFCCKALNNTVNHYKAIYYENDYYRHKKLLDVQELSNDLKRPEKALLDQLASFFSSPFRKDRSFVIQYMAQMTRDRIEKSSELINALFFDKIFNLMLRTNDEKIRLKSFEIMCNMIHQNNWRKKLATQGYFKQVYASMEVTKIDEKTLEKLSWMTTLVCFHPDMIEQIQNLKLLNFIMKLIDTKFPAVIRSNAVLAISLLTYHEQLFEDLISNGVIDLVMNLCMKKDDDLQVKQFSTLALVHFALSKLSINILIDKGIMTLFNSLGNLDNVQIQTNVSWIFLALCNNGITGRQMLDNGITRDMFLVSCNPQFHQIRHLVIAGFAELGRCTELRETEAAKLQKSFQKIKEKAIVGMHQAFSNEAEQTIEILLRFSISSQEQFKVTAYWALKDYILLNHGHLINDLSGIIRAFVNGSAEQIEQVNTECANAISFLITHHLVFGTEQTSEDEEEVKCHVLDALMLLTGSESRQVRTRAFSTLSTLSTYASQSENVMAQIQGEIKIPSGMLSSKYCHFIQERLTKDLTEFHARYFNENIETQFSGLYCLLRLAKDPSGKVADETSQLMHKFFFPEFVEPEKPADSEKPPESVCSRQVGAEDEFDTRNIQLESLNEKFFQFVFKALLFTKDRKILYRILDVVNFYIKHETTMQFQIIEPSIILWMLRILDNHRSDQYLCLLSAKTVLKVVETHSVVFDYQEMAIIKNFNRALENIEGSTDVESSAEQSEDEEQDEKKAESSSIQKTETPEEPESKGSQKMLSGIIQAKQTSEATGSKENSKNLSNMVQKNQPVFQRRNTIDQRGNVIEQQPMKKQAMELRDSLIKSFMVIFTNEKSQHLLLNKDIIDIAFNCLEFCSEISIEAKRNLSRLISIIFKFPQVQDRIIDEQVVLGVVHLLHQKSTNQEIIRHAVRACGYIALNFNFVNSVLSLEVTKALTPLLSEDLESSVNTPTEGETNKLIFEARQQSAVQVAQAHGLFAKQHDNEQASDRDNCIFAVANLLKGRSANAMHFVESGCCEKIMTLILNENTSIEQIDLYLSSLAQLANQKKVFRAFLENPTNLHLLPQCLEKCMQSCDKWHTFVRELSLYSRIFSKKESEKTDKEVLQERMQKRAADNQKIMNLDHTNVDAAKALDNVLEATQSFNLQMAPMCKIRSNCYHLFKMCFKFRFQPDYWIDRCHIFECVIDDLRRDDINDFLFHNLTLCLVSVQKDPESARRMLTEHGEKCLQIFEEIKDQSKKLVFLKTLCQLVLIVPDYICSDSPHLFARLLDKAIEFADSSEEITENVLWLQTSLLDLYQSDEQLEAAIEVFSSLQTAQVLAKCLRFPSERITLQTLKSFSSLGALPQFRATLLIDLGDDIFPTMAELITKRLPMLRNSQLEVETELVQFLTHISSSEHSPTKDALTVAARRRIVQQGFMEYFLGRAVAVGYSISDDADMLEDEMHEVDIPTATQNSDKEKPDFEKLFKLNFDEVDEIEKSASTNMLVEQTMHLTANVTEQAENVQVLLSSQCQLLAHVHSLVQKTLDAVNEISLSQIPEDNLMSLSYGNLTMIKAVSQVLRNLCTHSETIQETKRSKKRTQVPVSSQHLTIQAGLLDLTLQALEVLADYDVHVNLYSAIGNLLTSPHSDVTQAAVQKGCLNQLLLAQENSAFFKVRRICTNVLGRVDEDLYDLNKTASKMQ